MSKLDFTGYEKEIERCSRLYNGLGKAEKFISAVFDSINKYFKSNPVISLPAVKQDQSDEQIRAGKSLSLTPSVETSKAVGLLKEISKAIRVVNPKLKATVKTLHERLDQFAAESSAEVSKEDLFRLRDLLIKETLLDRDMATFLFSIMLLSFYQQLLLQSKEGLRTDLWEGGDCPLCGVMPHYGLLSPEEGAKQLECWLCGTQWVHTRVKCPYCSNEEREELGYFTVEGNDICRVNYCKSCCHYYKVFDARQFPVDGALYLAIHNLATLDYDILARGEGFTPGSGLEWINESELPER